jgi:hypothetical protein
MKTVFPSPVVTLTPAHSAGNLFVCIAELVTAFRRHTRKRIVSTSRLYLNVSAGMLTITSYVPHRIAPEVTAFSMPFDGPEVSGSFSANFLRLFKKFAELPYEYRQSEGDRPQLIIKEQTFEYAIDLHQDEFEIVETVFRNSVDSPIFNSVGSVILGITTREFEGLEMTITTTDNYFADLNTAVALGIVAKGVKPKKADLYAAIADYNAKAAAAEQVQVADSLAETRASLEKLIADVPAVESPVVTVDVPAIAVEVVSEAVGNAYTALRSQWNEKREAKASGAAKKATVKKSTAMADALYQPNDYKQKPSAKILQLIEILKAGATPEQVCAAMGWKTWSPEKSVVRNYGYKIKVYNGVCSIP